MDNKKFILDYFINGRNNKAKLIDGLPRDKPAYCFRSDGELGVLVPFKSDEIIYESFSGSKLYSGSFTFGEENRENLLKLSINLTDNGHNEVFAIICSSFIDPDNREELINDPVKWWKDWKEVIGNGELNKSPYDLIAEMISLDYMAQQNLNPKWEGPTAGTVDIRSNSYDCEVKSSINRYEDTVEISSQFQLLITDRPLHLFYIVFQKSEAGVSIDDMMNKLIKSGFENNFIEKMIQKRGYLPGNSSRKEKYQQR